MTHQRRRSQFARSLIGSFGEPVTLERFAGDSLDGGYATRKYHDPEEIRVVLRPGEIDVPFTDTTGDHGTTDLWCITDTTVALEAKDRVTRHREFGDGGYGRDHFGTGDTFEVSMPKFDTVHEVSVYSLEEADSRR